MCPLYRKKSGKSESGVETPCLWAYSSAKIHCGINTYDSLGVNRIFDYIKQKPKTWKEWINEPDDFGGMRGIREKTRTGRPLGPNDFIEKLEGQLKRVFKLKPKGRPKKKVDK